MVPLAGAVVAVAFGKDNMIDVSLVVALLVVAAESVDSCST